MAGYDRDEITMVSDTHPTSVGTRSFSISTPMSSMESYETGNNLVGSTGPLRSARRAPLVHKYMNHHDRDVQNWDKFFVICCLVSIFIDPLFFLLLYVQQDNKCIALDSRMAIIIAVSRSIIDVVYLMNTILKVWFADVEPESRGVGAGELVDHPIRTARKYGGWFFIDLLLCLPLPQILVVLAVPTSLGSSRAKHANNLTLWAVLIQYIPRLFRFLPLLVGKSPNGLIFETAWANFVTNFFTFMLSGHVIGSCWYLFGLQRVQQCLRDACGDTGFGHTCLHFIDCGDFNAGNFYRFDPNWKNWTKNENAAACFSGDSFAYGIYKPVVNLTSKDITTRYVFSLFWGFQQISTLAGNQQPSYFVWEVLFTMLIVGVGLLLFAFLIGNMQNFLQALGRRRQELALRGRDVKQWMKHQSFPEALKKRVTAAEVCNWAATREVNEGMVIENLPEDIQRDVRRHLFKSVTTNRIFALMDQHILDAIFERLKRTVYIEGSEILYPGGVVDNIVFIVRGKLESIGDDGIVTPLCEGSVCGEELLTWVLEHASVSKDGKKIKVTGQRLLSNRIVRCLTNVKAFSLRATDLEEVTDLYAKSLRNPRIQRAIRYQSPY